MRGIIRVNMALSVTAALLAVLSPLRADTSFSGMVKLFSSIYLEDHSAGARVPHEAGEFGLRRLEVRFSLAGNVTDKVSYALRLEGFASPDTVSIGAGGGLFPEASSSGAPLGSESFDLLLYEASVKVSGFLLKKMDLTIGRQRISWGTADKMNVVDNLNPVDLANFFTFDPDYFAERRPQTAVNLEYYFGAAAKLQFVWLVERQYSPLPRGFSAMASEALGGNANIRLAARRHLFQDSNFGIRLTAVLGKADVGLSCYRGNFHLPVLTGLAASAAEVELRYDYPGQIVFGLDLAGEAFGLGLWGEAAYVVPERIRGSVSMPVLWNGELTDFRSTFQVFERGWLRWVVGADTTLPWGSGLYLNVQYVKGLFDESAFSAPAVRYFRKDKGMFFGEPEDYLAGRVEYPLLRGDLKIGAGGLLEMTGDAAALVFMPGLEYRVSDVFSLRAGMFWTAGDEEGTKFGPFKKDKVVYLSMKASW
jgi:hypothetical protein